MKISQMIEGMKKAMTHYGDLPIFTYEGEIGAIRFVPSKDGLSPRGEIPKEIVIEFQTKWSGE